MDGEGRRGGRRPQAARIRPDKSGRGGAQSLALLVGGRMRLSHRKREAVERTVTMRGATQVSVVLLLVAVSDCAVITGACERDVQCGAGTCCAISLWLRGLRMCTPLGREGEECHPGSRKIPFFRKRQHHTCPCLPNLLCSWHLGGRYRCSADLKNMNF